MNLIDVLKQELSRNREILQYYEEIPTGAFGAAMIKAAIQKGEDALASGDATRMLRALKELKTTE